MHPQIKTAIGTTYARLTTDWISFQLYQAQYRTETDAWMDHPYFLLHVPKCAGISISTAHGMPDPGHRLIHQLPRAQQRRLKGRPALCILRDPVDRMASTFRYGRRLQNTHGFTTLADIQHHECADTWMRNMLERDRPATNYFLRPGAAFVQAARDNTMPVLVARMEDVQEAVDRISGLCNRPSPTVAHLNTTAQDPRSSGFSPATTAAINHRYAADHALLEMARGGPVWLMPDARPAVSPSDRRHKASGAGLLQGA